MGLITILKDKEKSLVRKHPWVFSGAIKNVAGNPQMGETVELVDMKGNHHGFGAFSPHSQIRVRMWTFNEQETVNEEFFYKRMKNALFLRKSLNLEEMSDAYRIVNSENDGLPGLIIDKYGDFLCCQFLSAGSEYWKKTIIEQIKLLLSCKGIFERSDSSSRFKEGLNKETKLLWGEEPPDELIIREHNYKLIVDLKNGHKTGFYLDQRENRRTLGEFTRGKDVLNCFSYTGGFSVAASLSDSGSVTNVEASAPVLEIAQKNAQLNGCGNILNIKADVFSYLRKCDKDKVKFDVIILDPPKFAESASQVEKAAKGYKDINLQAFRLLNPGGKLFTFSCSGHIKQDLFEKIVADAALDSGVNASIIKYLTQAADHNVALSFPEGKYLKGLICAVSD